VSDQRPSNQNTGHGHVRPRPDGVRARCGGPGMCAECSRELAREKLGKPPGEQESLTSKTRLLETLRKRDEEEQAITSQPPPYSIYGLAADEIERLNGMLDDMVRFNNSQVKDFERRLHENNEHIVELQKKLVRERRASVPPVDAKAIPLVDSDWPLIELGFGLIEVANGKDTCTGRPALIFGRNGTGKIGEPTQPNRVHLPGETLAVVTFANVESLDVVADELAKVRATLTKPDPYVMKPSEQATFTKALLRSSRKVPDETMDRSKPTGETSARPVHGPSCHSMYHNFSSGKPYPCDCGAESESAQ
jgi:hypothetical protein